MYQLKLHIFRYLFSITLYSVSLCFCAMHVSGQAPEYECILIERNIPFWLSFCQISPLSPLRPPPLSLSLFSSPSTYLASISYVTAAFSGCLVPLLDTSVIILAKRIQYLQLLRSSYSVAASTAIAYSLLYCHSLLTPLLP